MKLDSVFNVYSWHIKNINITDKLDCIVAPLNKLSLKINYNTISNEIISMA